MSAGAVLDADPVDVVDESFFAPVPTDMLDGLIGQYKLQRTRIAEVARFMAGPTPEAVLHYFLEGNATEDRGRITLDSARAQLFSEPGAVASLDASFWSKALQLTDVLDLMPQKRRNEWSEQIRNPQGKRKHRHSDDKSWEIEPIPSFTEDNVRSTLTALLNLRATFFGERVDGIFRGLSGEHVTNAPEAFGKRMIIARVLNSYDTIDHDRAGLINDLRCVIAKFMGRDEPSYRASESLLPALRGNWGEWVPIDGGALRIRLYKKGTAHMEVHPDMAWRLNLTLSSLYPLAIPPEFRQKPKRQAKNIAPIQRPLPFRVLDLLASMELFRVRVREAWPERYDTVPNTVRFRYGHDAGATVVAEAERVLQAIGGTPTKVGHGDAWAFDYDPLPVLRQIATSGCLPDRVAHQFYPTPEKLARICAELAEIGESDTVLEPSAGQGDLAAVLPKDRTTCVEISPLHCAILKARGYTTVQADFVDWADIVYPATMFDRVVMNPPFADGRAKLHAESAAGLVKPGGRLVAVLPASMRGKEFLADFDHQWSSPYEGEFAGTSAVVVVLLAKRRAGA